MQIQKILPVQKAAAQKMAVQNNNMILPETGKIEANRLNGESATKKVNVQAFSFKDALEGAMEQKTLQFSKHASMRLNARDITLSNEQIKRVEDGVTKARAKGINDSLVLVDNVALVVNIRSKTVITALPKEQTGENVFTNIDGAVIV